MSTQVFTQSASLGIGAADMKPGVVLGPLAEQPSEVGRLVSLTPADVARVSAQLATASTKADAAWLLGQGVEPPSLSSADQPGPVATWDPDKRRYFPNLEMSQSRSDFMSPIPQLGSPDPLNSISTLFKPDSLPRLESFPRLESLSREESLPRLDSWVSDAMPRLESTGSLGASLLAASSAAALAPPTITTVPAQGMQLPLSSMSMGQASMPTSSTVPTAYYMEHSRKHTLAPPHMPPIYANTNPHLAQHLQQHLQFMGGMQPNVGMQMHSMSSKSGMMVSGMKVGHGMGMGVSGPGSPVMIKPRMDGGGTMMRHHMSAMDAAHMNDDFDYTSVGVSLSVVLRMTVVKAVRVLNPCMRPGCSCCGVFYKDFFSGKTKLYALVSLDTSKARSEADAMRALQHFQVHRPVVSLKYCGRDVEGSVSTVKYISDTVTPTKSYWQVMLRPKVLPEFGQMVHAYFQLGCNQVLSLPFEIHTKPSEWLCLERLPTTWGKAQVAAFLSRIGTQPTVWFMLGREVPFVVAKFHNRIEARNAMLNLTSLPMLPESNGVTPEPMLISMMASLNRQMQDNALMSIRDPRECIRTGIALQGPENRAVMQSLVAATTPSAARSKRRSHSSGSSSKRPRTASAGDTDTGASTPTP